MGRYRTRRGGRGRPDGDRLHVYLDDRPELVLGAGEELDLTHVHPEFRLALRRLFEG